jgi:hypothetical protein
MQTGRLTEHSSPLILVCDFFTSKKILLFCGGMFFFAFALFSTISPNALINGDAALYEQQITHFDFSQRTIHLGYYFLGIPFVHLLPLPADYALNLMNCFFGSLSIVLLFLIGFTVSKTVLAGFVASIFLLSNYIFVFNAVYAEVYLPQLFFFLLSVQLVLVQNAVLGGLSFALAFLISPGALFGLPCLTLLLGGRRQLVHFYSGVFFLLSIGLGFHVEDYLFGGRGLLKALQSHMGMNQVLLKETKEFLSSLIFYLPFILVGSAQLIKDKSLRRLGAAIFSLWFITFLFGERFGDVPSQLPTYALFCFIGGLGFDYIARCWKKRRPVIKYSVYLLLIICTSMTLFVTFRRINETNRNLIEYRNTVVALNHRALPHYFVVGEWTQGILFEHYLFQRSYTGVWINTEWLSGDWGPIKQKESINTLNTAINSRREIWLLDNNPFLFSYLQKHGYSIQSFRNVYRAALEKL